MVEIRQELFHIMYFLDYGQSFGGAVNTLLQRAILMEKAGQKVTVVISDYIDGKMEEGYSQISAIQNIDLLRLTYPVSSQPEDIDVVSMLQNYDTIKAAIKNAKPDILHSVQLNPIAELVSRELHIPHVMDIYPLIPDFFKIRYMNVFPHYHICDSEYYAKKWRQYLHTESVCIRTVVNCVNKVEKRCFNKRKELIFLCVGSIYQQKNQLEVIKAFQLALQHNVEGRLFIYGYDVGEYPDRCKEFVRENGLEEKIYFKGFCNKMETIYPEADVLICGSTRESYPNVISEAMYNGLAIISTPVAGVPEVIHDHENGYLCKGYSAEDILEKILELDEDRKSGRIDGILQCAYETFAHCHSARHITSELLAYYNHLKHNFTEHSNVQIQDVKNRFSAIIAEFRTRSHMFTDIRAVQRKLWYIYYVRDMIKNKVVSEKRKVYIWGTGRYGKAVKEIFDAFWASLSLDL